MNQLQCSSSDEDSINRNSSFQSLIQCQPQKDQDFQDIIEVQTLDRQAQKSLRQTVKEKYKMCCSGIKTMKTNIAFNLRHSTFDIFTQRQKVILNKNQAPTLLGKSYQNDSKGKESFLIDFNNVIWFTYRTGIEGVQTDAGWGCMIRVCQMVLAQAFKRISCNIQLNQIIDYFKDSPEAYFSLTNICQRGNIMQRWTSSIEIFTVLQVLIKQFQQIPLHVDIYSAGLQVQSLKQLDKIKYPTLIFISNRLGKSRFEEEYLDHFFDLMKIQYFLGALGGNGGEALYLIGQYSRKIIFLDPHYVQQNQNKQEWINTSTYFQSQPYSIDVKQLAPSCAFTFLVKSSQQYQDLLKKLYVMQNKHSPWLCLQVHSQQLKDMTKDMIKMDEQFQII